MSFWSQVIRGDISRHRGCIEERHPTPELARFGNTIPPDKLRAVGQPEDHAKAEAGTRAQLQELIRTGPHDGCTATDTAAAASN